MVPVVAAAGTVSLASGRDTLRIGETASLQASFTDTRGRPIVGRTITWESSNPAVATVAADGAVLGVAFGAATITARIDTAKGTRLITVTRAGTANGWVDVSTGSTNTCGATAAGDAYCWGTNNFGQLGDGTTTASNSPKKVGAPTGVKFATVSVASAMVCGVSTVGNAYCWGTNVGRGIGSATELTSTSAVRVDPPTAMTFAQVKTGSAHACALNTVGDVHCWGLNSQGALGNNETANSTVPVKVSAPAGVVFASLASGSNANCAVTSTGSVYCWGFNDSGQLGNGSTVTSRIAVRVNLPANVTATSVVGAVNGFHFCVTTTAGSLYCWGRNIGGQFGNGAKDFENSTPVLSPVPATLRIASLGVGTTSVCFVTTDRKIYCMGAGGRGELGAGNNTESLVPTLVSTPAGSSFDVVRGGFQTTCALSLTGDLYCWGAGTSGQIGNGASLDSSTPIRVALP